MEVLMWFFQLGSGGIRHCNLFATAAIPGRENYIFSARSPLMP